jgi:hypothetical protein
MNQEFNGTEFSDFIIIVILVVLFAFGSTELENYTSGPTPM